MTRKTRMTPFARFFIFLLFVAPLAYIGASYYRGEDGIAKIKSLLGKFKEDQPTIEAQKPTEENNLANAKRSELEVKIDSVLLNQKLIIDILKSNQGDRLNSKPDSL
ncbi:MAG: hypothetical protein RLZZ248_885 [Bacteroidota bacterium]|jgi:cell division protein FtsB